MATHNPPPQPPPIIQRLSSQNEATWLQIGSLAELTCDSERALNAYEAALRHNPYSFNALFKLAGLWRNREQYPKAIEFFERALSIDNTNGEVWSSLGHCFLQQGDLSKAYSAYQQAIHNLPNPKDPKLWYGIGILYDRYGTIEHAEEAFSEVMRMDPKFDKGNEIYFRLGIIYKQQGKYELSLQCFRYILHTPPRPLNEIDIWFQIGHVYEQQKEYVLAKEAYERVLSENPNHAKVLQQLGWLYHLSNTPYSDQDKAILYLSQSSDADPSEAQTWYLLGRCYMAQAKYNRAYDAYQQAVYLDGKNPNFWCSIGVLYYQINQFRDALDAYSRAIRLNPHISEVWYDLGTLYESCNNQINDARDAYTRAAELDPTNQTIRARLAYLNGAQTGGAAPVPQDISTTNLPPMNMNINVNFPGPNGGSTQAPSGPPHSISTFNGRSEVPATAPPPLRFPHGAGERSAGSEHLAPLAHPNGLPSPSVRGPHNLPNLMRDDQGRLADHGPSRPHGPSDHPNMGGPPGHDDYRSMMSNNYPRQHMKRPDHPNGMGVDVRNPSRLTPPSSIRPPGPPMHSRGPLPDGPYYRGEQHPGRREFDDSYKHQRGGMTPSYGRHEMRHDVRHDVRHEGHPSSYSQHRYGGYPEQHSNDPRRMPTGHHISGHPGHHPGYPGHGSSHHHNGHHSEYSIGRPPHPSLGPMSMHPQPDDRFSNPNSRNHPDDKLRPQLSHSIRQTDPQDSKSVDSRDLRLDPRGDARLDPRGDPRGPPSRYEDNPNHDMPANPNDSNIELKSGKGKLTDITSNEGASHFAPGPHKSPAPSPKNASAAPDVPESVTKSPAQNGTQP